MFVKQVKKMHKIRFFATFFVFLIAVFSVQFFLLNNIAFCQNNTANLDEYNLCDEFEILTKNQEATSLCWAFSASRSFETYLQKKLDQKIDISEVWASLAYTQYVRDASQNLSDESNNNLNYIFGNSGHTLYFQRGINSYGLVLENDLPFGAVSEIDMSNYAEKFEQYKTFATTTISDINFEWAGYLTSEKSQVDDGQVIENIKNYLVNFGSVYTQVQMADMHDNNGTFCICSAPVQNGQRTNHALSIIGWDDNYAFADAKGAFLAMNSYGQSAEFIYIMYNDANVLDFSRVIKSFKFNGVEYISNIKESDKNFSAILIVASGISVALIILPTYFVNKKQD